MPSRRPTSPTGIGKRKVGTGRMKLASVELTALDIVRYPRGVRRPREHRHRARRPGAWDRCAQVSRARQWLRALGRPAAGISPRASTSSGMPLSIAGKSISSTLEGASRSLVIRRAIVRAEGVRLSASSAFSARRRRVAHSLTTRREPRKPCVLRRRHSSLALRWPAAQGAREMMDDMVKAGSAPAPRGQHIAIKAFGKDTPPGEDRSGCGPAPRPFRIPDRRCRYSSGGRR